ncbi:MAG: hypothetical protein OXJ52_09825 [Oligoflexia bacterium]|nr:hypothetical protein [Oligoflexia bacterium]
MMRNRMFFRLLILLSVFTFLSCERAPNIPEHLDHDFLFGTEEGLYRIRDLTMILDEKAVIKPRRARSKKQSVDYRAILSAKEDLYEKNRTANVSNLEELLRIRTVSEEGKKIKISSGLDNIYIDTNIPFLNEYEIVDYTFPQKKMTAQQKTLKKLLGKIREFKGFPGTDYYILPHFVGNYLILYKLSPPDKIPYNELPLAKRIGDMLAVPFVGYSLEYCQAEKLRGSNNIKETLKNRPLCKGRKSEAAEYVRLWEHNKQVFEYQPKLDFFQKNFFEGQWLYHKTRIRSPMNSEGTIEHTPFQKAKLVEFYPVPGKMDVLEVNNLRQEDEERILFIPVKWTDYEIARDSENLDPSFSERLKNSPKTTQPYLEIKFDELITNELDHIEKGGKSLKSVIITNDYISFDIEAITGGVATHLIKHAFKRYIENTDYKEKQWFKTDNLLFPLHSIKRKYYEDPTDHTLSDEDRFKRAIRFNTHSTEILWHFSKQTSKLAWIRNLGHEATDLLNTALQAAGRGSNHQIKIVLDGSLDKELGDIRYNILNLIHSEGETPKEFEWGPNIANPITGEVISATANVWVTHILSNYISIIRNYIRFHVYPPAWTIQPFSEKTANFIDENVNTKNLQCADLSQKPLGTTPFLHEKITSICEEVSDFITDNEGKTFHPKGPPLQDDDVVNSCAQKLAQAKILQSILNSMLRSFGLKDMPSASVDIENFYKNSEIEEFFGKTSSEVTTDSHPEPPQYSSVMGYMNTEYPILAVPGKLDIAVLRFLYFDKVEKAEGGFLDIPSGADKDPNNPQKSILKMAQDCKEDLKNYKMCGLNKDPLLCSRNDYGISPLEIVSNQICLMHNHLLSSRNRYDSDKPPKYSSNPRFLKDIYKKWEEYRDEILAGNEKSILDYSFLNPDHINEYNQIIETALKDPNIKAYSLIRRPLFDYMKRLAFAPAKHCIYKEKSSIDNTPRYQAIALESIEEKILSHYPENSVDKDKMFMSCESPVVKDWGPGELVAEVGFFGKERRYLIRPNEKIDPIDEIQAFKLIYNQLITNFGSTHSNILKEPEFGLEYYIDWLAYITQGIDLNPYITGAITEDPDIPRDRTGQIQLNRALSYKIDTEKIIYDKRLWSLRSQAIKTYVSMLREHYPNFEDSQLPHLELLSSHQSFSLTELKNLVSSYQKYPDLHSSDIPFLTQAYDEWNVQKDNTFEQFIQKHPAVIYNSTSSTYVLPYIDNQTITLSQLFRQYNEFSNCVKEEQEETDALCDQKENKQAFIKLMLDTYK